MATFTKRVLQSSTNGRPIAITTTASPGNTIHTAVAGTADIDEVWVYATNLLSNSVKVTIQFGGTDASDSIVQTIEPESTQLIIPGLAANNALVIRAYSNAASGSINISGFVNRRTA